MSFISSFNVSVSGMAAQRQRVNTISENIANANTTRTPEGGPYRRRIVTLAAVSNDRTFEEELRSQERSLDTATEVKVVGISQDNRAPILRYEPGHPDANEEGYVAMPNVNMMEEMAGAPKQAMGIRTAGEKTAFEVQELANAAGRIFQEKVNQFEIDIIEKCLNSMLETAVRYMNKADIVRVMDDDLGVASFMTITKEDITAKGHIRPIGARHFAQQAQIMQNLSQVAASPVWAKIEPHVGDKKLAKLVEELLQLERFDLYGDNAGVMDKVDTQRLAQEGQETLMAEGMTPLGEE